MTTKQAHADAQTSGNVLTLEVENIIHGWPTYVIDFTPEQPGPMKLILRVKDGSKPGSCTAWKKRSTGANITVKMDTSDDPDINVQKASAIPVILGGVLKDPVSLKRKIIEATSDDEDKTMHIWPPRRHVRQLNPDVSLRALHTIKTFPASLEDVTDG